MSRPAAYRSKARRIRNTTRSWGWLRLAENRNGMVSDAIRIETNMKYGARKPWGRINRQAKNIDPA